MYIYIYVYIHILHIYIFRSRALGPDSRHVSCVHPGACLCVKGCDDDRGQSLNALQPSAPSFSPLRFSSPPQRRCPCEGPYKRNGRCS